VGLGGREGGGWREGGKEGGREGVRDGPSVGRGGKWPAALGLVAIELLAHVEAFINVRVGGLAGFRGEDLRPLQEAIHALAQLPLWEMYVGRHGYGICVKRDPRKS
jgi:hypothetical protein